MNQLTPQEILSNRSQQPLCGSCFYFRMDCKNTDHCIECEADYRDTGIKTGYAKRYQNAKQEGVPERDFHKRRSYRSAPAWIK